MKVWKEQGPPQRGAQKDAQIGGTMHCKTGAAGQDSYHPSRNSTAQSWGARVKGVAQ